VLSLDHVGLLAGTTYRGQYEERIRMIVEETTASPDVILFIDELHNLIGQGTALGAAMDAANMLKPALVRGDFRVIGATTDEEYDRYVAGDPALERRFQKLLVRELGVPETLAILRARKERLERHHNVVIADEALVALLTGAPPGTPPPVPRPTPIPMEPPSTSSIGELEAELSRVLMDEGIVVRAHDVERVVGLMAGQPVQWQR